MPPKNKAAVTLGRLGGQARAKNLTKERKSELGKMGRKGQLEKLSTDVCTKQAKNQL